MNRLLVMIVGGTLIVGAAGLMASAQQGKGLILVPGDRPVTEEQVRAQLQSDGWSNVVISRDGPHFQVTASRNGQAGKMTVDSQTGRLLAADDDDDD
jgi:predicted aspartyl protease